MGALLAGTLKAFGRKNRSLILMGLFSEGRFLWGRKVRVGQSIGWPRRRWVVFLRVFWCVHVTLSGGCVCVHTAACVRVCVCALWKIYFEFVFQSSNISVSKPTSAKYLVYLPSRPCPVPSQWLKNRKGEKSKFLSFVFQIETFQYLGHPPQIASFLIGSQ